MLTTVPAQGILKFTRSSVRSEVATEVVVASHLKILVPDTVDVVAVGGLGDVNLALVDQFLKEFFVFLSPGLDSGGISHGQSAD